PPHSPLSTPRPPPNPTPFPYTTLFRSEVKDHQLQRPHDLLIQARVARVMRDLQHQQPDRAAEREHRCDRKHPVPPQVPMHDVPRSEEHTSELQSRENLVCRLLLEKKNS